MTDEHTGASEQSRTSWVAIQTLRPEYPIDYPHPLALVAVRVKATYQLNGQLDNFNLIASRRCLDWDTATQSWVARETHNPASLFRFACSRSPIRSRSRMRRSICRRCRRGTTTAASRGWNMTRSTMTTDRCGSA